MKFTGNWCRGLLTGVVWLVVAGLAGAGDPAPLATPPGGCLRVCASNDPHFPLDEDAWFFQFAPPGRPPATTGTVAITRRRGPQLHIRLLAWRQLGPATLEVWPLGLQGPAPVAEIWHLATTSSGALLLRRHTRLTMLTPASP